MWAGIKKLLYFILLCAVTVVIAYVLLLWVNQAKGQEMIEHLRVPLLIFRVAIVVALIGFWPQLVRYFSTRKGREWPQERTVYMHSIRWKVAGILVLVELIVMQNAIGRIIELIKLLF